MVAVLQKSVLIVTLEARLLTAAVNLMPSVAILGASADRSKYGNKSLRAHLAEGYDVYPVNPKGGAIEGLTVYKTLTDVPVGRLDRISVYLPPAVGLTMLPEIAAKDCGELWFNPGSESDEVIAKARELGLDPIVACSIVDLDRSPDEFGDR
jgi:predicted CoA-binding protein